MGHPDFSFPHHPLASNCQDGQSQPLNLLTESFLEPQCSHFFPPLPSSFPKSEGSAGCGSGDGRKERTLLRLPSRLSSYVSPSRVTETAESLPPLQARPLRSQVSPGTPTARCDLKQQARVSVWLFGHFLQCPRLTARKTHPRAALCPVPAG